MADEEKPMKIEEEKKIEEVKPKVVEKTEKKIEKVKPKKTEAVVNGYSLPISAKHSIAICKMIKGKRIEDAIQYLEKVALLKTAVPMRGEIPHRKGNIGPGRYPQKAAKNFIVLLKSLAANASDLEEPRIYEAVSNLASRPYGKFGRIKKKRTHIKLVAKEIKMINKSKKPGKKVHSKSVLTNKK